MAPILWFIWFLRYWDPLNLSARGFFSAWQVLSPAPSQALSQQSWQVPCAWNICLLPENWGFLGVLEGDIDTGMGKYIYIYIEIWA